MSSGILMKSQPDNKVEIKNKAERHYGIDMLKILSIFMVLVLHILGQGGILNNCAPDSAQYYSAWLLETASLCAINCFAICTGYLMVGRKIKYRKIVMLWTVVIFYTVLIIWIGSLFGVATIKTEDFFPVVFTEYWYFTAYFGMFFLIPFINKLIDSMSKSDMVKLLLTFFVLFSILPLIPREGADPFALKNGYSMGWLICMYFVGAGIKRFDIGVNRFSKKVYLSGYIFTVILTWIIKIAFEKLFNAHPIDITKEAVYFAYSLMDYTSPTIVGAAVFLFMFFLKLDMTNIFNKVVKCISPMVFQVYIIHLNYVIWDNIIKNRFVTYADKSAVIMVFMTIITALVIFTACVVIDFIRIKLFDVLKINFLIGKASDNIIQSQFYKNMRKKFIAGYKEDTQ